MLSALTGHVNDSSEGVSSDLGALRRHAGLSQTTLASRLGVSQPHIAQIEQQHDMLLATLRRYVEALGGALRVVAELPEASIDIRLPRSENSRSIN